ncbi:MAG: hypothetical protein HEQ23_02115 [Tepidisphaera sp.]
MRSSTEFDEASFYDYYKSTATLPSRLPDGSGSIDALLKEFSRFYTLRFVTQDFDKYVQWRRASGYILRAYDDLQSNWQIEQDYSAIFKSPVPPGRDVETMFKEFFSTGLLVENGSAKPVKIADSPEGLAVVAGVVTSPSQSRPFVSGVMPAEIWQGKSSGTTRNWWNAPSSWRDVLKRDRRVVWAEIGLVTTFGDGAVHPRVHSFYWDPRRSLWVLDGVYDYNVARVGTALEY